MNITVGVTLYVAPIRPRAGVQLRPSLYNLLVRPGYPQMIFPATYSFNVSAGIRTCSIESRSRTVIVPSSSV